MNYSNRYSSDLEYIIGGSYTSHSHQKINYFSRFVDDNYIFSRGETIEIPYEEKIRNKYRQNKPYHKAIYAASHSFAPEMFLSPSRPIARFVDDNNEARSIAEEIFQLMMKKKMPENISINVLQFDEFKAVHSKFGLWSNGILGFSIHDNNQIFARENHLDALMLVIGHEIGHVLTETLPNKHDEEAKAFAFSIEWAKTIKEHNVSNLGLNIGDEVDFNPAINGLHDVAFSFVDFMVKKGRKAIELHDDLAKKYTSIFNRFYYPK